MSGPTIGYRFALTRFGDESKFTLCLIYYLVILSVMIVQFLNNAYG